MNTEEKLMKCLGCVKEKTGFEPKVALILGSGLGGFGKKIDARAIVEYKDIEGFPISTVLGHEGRFIFGYVEGVPIVTMQ